MVSSVSPVLGELVQDLSHLLVHHRNVIERVGPIAFRRGVVGHIRRGMDLVGVVQPAWVELRRVVGVILRPVLAFVRRGEVEDGEERLVPAASAPMGLSAAFVPRLFRRDEIVVFLAVVGAVVAGVAQVGRVGPYKIGQSIAAPHVVRAERRGIHAGDQARPARSANAGDAKGVVVTHPPPLPGRRDGGCRRRRRHSSPDCSSCPRR